MIVFFRVLFIVVSMVLSALYFTEWPLWAPLTAAAVAGFVALVVLILVEYLIHTFSARMFAAAISGLIVGFTLGHLFNQAYSALNITVLDQFSHIITPLIYHLSGFFVMMYFVINYDDLAFLDKIIREDTQASQENISYKILDTSVIIDGRIADLCINQRCGRQ